MGRPHEPPHPIRTQTSQLEADDGFRLQALGSLLHLKLHSLALVEGFIPLRLDCAVVHEDVLTALTLDEPIALAGVKPLDRSLFSTQLPTPCRMKLFALVVASRVHKKKAARAPPVQPSRYLKKQSQEPQTHSHYIIGEILYAKKFFAGFFYRSFW